MDIKGSSSSNKHIPQLRRQTSEELYEHAKSKENKKKGTAVSLCYEIHSLLRVLWSGKWGVVTPNNLVFGIWRFIPWFRSYRQQDAHEFFNCFIDRVNTELLQESKKHTCSTCFLYFHNLFRKCFPQLSNEASSVIAPTI